MRHQRRDPDRYRELKFALATGAILIFCSVIIAIAMHVALNP